MNECTDCLLASHSTSFGPCREHMGDVVLGEARRKIAHDFQPAVRRAKWAAEYPEPKRSRWSRLVFG